jgi:hypothetical protein
MAFTMFAGFQMRMIAPDDPGWNRSNPHWVALFKTVEQDLARDVGPALQARMADGVREIAGTLGSHLTAADVRQLLAFYRSEKGQRYIAFQQRLGAIQTQGVTQLTGAIMGAGGNTAPSDAPSQKRLDARRRVLANSWMSLIVPDAMTTNQTSSTQQPDKRAFFDAMLDVVAKTHGPELDALEREYANDLPQIEAFHHSPAATSLLSAMRAVMQQAGAHPQSSDPFKAALDCQPASKTDQLSAANIDQG